MSHRRMDLAAPFIATCLAVAGVVLPAAAQTAKVESQVLLTAEPGLQYAISPKGQHVTAVVLRGSRQVVAYDGVDGPRFDEVLALQSAPGGKVVLSDDGSRYAYVGRLGQEFVVVVEGKEVARGPWDATLAQRGQTPVYQIGFTPRSKHWYMILYKADQSRQHWQLIVDGKAGPVSQGDIQPTWSPEGEHHAYIQDIFPQTAAQHRSVLIVDGKPAPYVAGEPQFTSDGLHLFTKRNLPNTDVVEVLADGQPFMRVQGGIQLHMAPTGPGVLGVSWASPPNGARHAFLTVGNRKVPGSECPDNAGLSHIYMSSDAKHFAARCRTWIMTDAKKGQEYADGVSSVVFTTDGRPVYHGKSSGKYFVVVGDQESHGFGGIVGEMQATREQRSTTNFELAPVVVRGNKVGFITHSGQGGNNTVVVVEGKKYQSQLAKNLTFSPDGSRFAFLAGSPCASAVVDGVEYNSMTVDPELGNVGFQGTFQWTADSKHVAWIAGGPAPGVAIDGKLFATQGDPRFMKFTADGKHIVWLTRAQPGHLVFVDGVRVQELPQNMALENEADIYWSLVAQDGEAMKRFKITPGSETSVETALAKAK